MYGCEKTAESCKTFCHFAILRWCCSIRLLHFFFSISAFFLMSFLLFTHTEIQLMKLQRSTGLRQCHVCIFTQEALNVADGWSDTIIAHVYVALLSAAVSSLNLCIPKLWDCIGDKLEPGLVQYFTARTSKAMWTVHMVPPSVDKWKWSRTWMPLIFKVLQRKYYFITGRTALNISSDSVLLLFELLFFSNH